MAFFSVVVKACCPTTLSNVVGRYFLADTIYSLILFALYGAKIVQGERKTSSLFERSAERLSYAKISARRSAERQADFERSC